MNRTLDNKTENDTEIKVFETVGTPVIMYESQF